ncbi:MAG TPA: D-alanyl-D-alanine carboxypeptidase [Solirubrobacteraceae bacterium]|nr:D-alanyl-D-alanine carboxypeptidase [Solirubrobacteraceae bacterium]
MGLVAGVVVITLAVLGSLSHTSTKDGQLDAGSPALSTPAKTKTAPRPGTASITFAAPRGPQTGAESHLESVLNQAMGQAGPNSGAVVYDIGAHRTLYAVRAGVKRPPASVEKIWTTTALMLKLGPNARLRTSVLGTGSLRHGVWHGNLYLRGGGDPTFGDPTFNHFWEQGYGPTANQVASQLMAHGIHRVTGRLYGDESLFDKRRGGLMTNYAPDVPDFGGQLSALTYDHGTTAPHYDPATFAARELALTLQASHVQVKASRHDGHTPRGAHMLATVSSPPMGVMTRLMDVPSDDLFAELFTKQLGVLFGRGGTISDGAHVIASTIASAYDVHPRILDGSGLSRKDGTSPAEIVELLDRLWHTAAGRELVDSLPTVGRNGTVQGIGVKTPAAGNCVAKTGTLNYVTNLAGYCSARGRQTLAFGLFVDGPDNGTAELLESRMIGAIAGY